MPAVYTNLNIYICIYYIHILYDWTTPQTASVSILNSNFKQKLLHWERPLYTLNPFGSLSIEFFDHFGTISSRRANDQERACFSHLPGRIPQTSVSRIHRHLVNLIEDNCGKATPHVFPVRHIPASRQSCCSEKDLRPVITQAAGTLVMTPMLQITKGSSSKPTSQ